VGKSLNRSARTRRGGSIPGAVYVVSVVCLLGQLVSLAHEATERHVRCAEHGDLSHVGAGADSAGSSAALDALESRAARPRSVADRAAVASVAHAHCAFLFTGRRERSKPILLVAPAPEPALPPEPRAAPIVAAPAERILLSAPKIAPPRRIAAFC
jgi:hypothetical protein